MHAERKCVVGGFLRALFLFGDSQDSIGRDQIPTSEESFGKRIFSNQRLHVIPLQQQPVICDGGSGLVRYYTAGA
jgi:hypothetical protein